ncbi:kinase-like protein [Ophiobolus disseminans]|uniref:Kinase-like protein n=1 Tax=Ophiobolus disseminans TaxID=1469910 RepID=A0A6A6ZSI2_9PLEO|nr:kinase-like protein [Ophiobolus disseminans]
MSQENHGQQLPDLTTAEGLLKYLSHGADAKIQCLGGGTANYLYRVEDVRTGEVSVYKHAAPYLSSNKIFLFDQARMHYEARILQKISQLQNGTARFTKAVRLLDYDVEAKLLHIEDAGPRTLKAAYTHPSLSISAIANDLAKWLATLHSTSTDFSLSLKEGECGEKGNNPIAVSIYRHSYQNLHTALEKYGHDVSLAHRINSEFGTLLETENECVCHGDFWPGNVLVRLSPRDGQYPVQLTIVDWEMSRRGTSATDVGQFAAEAFLLDRFRGERGLRKAFLDAYIRNRGGGREWVIRMAVHWAVHIAFWPTRVDWTDHAGTQELVNIGVGVLRAALEGDWEGMNGSVLFEGVGVAWGEAFMRD